MLIKEALHGYFALLWVSDTHGSRVVAEKSYTYWASIDVLSRKTVANKAFDSEGSISNFRIKLYNCNLYDYSLV